MKNLLLLLISMMICTCIIADEKLTAKAQPIVEEAKRMYRSEMASWYGTDIFLAHYKQREKIGGYFSYPKGDSTHCLFYSKDAEPIVIGRVSFDSTFREERSKIDLIERNFDPNEKDYFHIRSAAAKALNDNPSDIFKFYENSNLNIIPLISGKEKKVYILTGPQVKGVVLFGNDYLITFDKKDNIRDIKALHANLIPIDDMEAVHTMHNHLPETGMYITATDLCTLMLYEKFTRWESHNVVSEKYLNIWNCKTNTLIVLDMEMVSKVKDDVEAKPTNNQKHKNK